MSNEVVLSNIKYCRPLIGFRVVTLIKTMTFRNNPIYPYISGSSKKCIEKSKLALNSKGGLFEHLVLEKDSEVDCINS